MPRCVFYQNTSTSFWGWMYLTPFFTCPPTCAPWTLHLTPKWHTDGHSWSVACDCCFAIIKQSLWCASWSQAFSLCIFYSNSCIYSVDFSCLFQDSQPKPDMEQKLRSASSVDELMSLIYPSYWAALKCRSKLSAAAASSASKLSQRPQPRRLRPLADTEEPTFAAAYLNLDILKSMFIVCFNIVFNT